MSSHVKFSLIYDRQLLRECKESIVGDEDLEEVVNWGSSLRQLLTILIHSDLFT